MCISSRRDNFSYFLFISHCVDVHVKRNENFAGGWGMKIN